MWWDAWGWGTHCTILRNRMTWKLIHIVEVYIRLYEDFRVFKVRTRIKVFSVFPETFGSYRNENESTLNL